MNQREIIEIFRQTGALLEGHFILRSGRHSRQFFQCAVALEQMRVVEKLGQALSKTIRDESIETVVAPAMGGLVIGQEVARQLGVRFVFLEKVDGALSLRRGFKFKQKENVLVVEDVITQGGRADETINIIRQNGGQVMAVAVLVNRSNGLYDPGIPVYSLLELQVETYDPGDLPEDLKEITAVKPGSN